jgi:hypothetical protein
VHRGNEELRVLRPEDLPGVQRSALTLAATSWTRAMVQSRKRRDRSTDGAVIDSRASRRVQNYSERSSL